MKFLVSALSQIQRRYLHGTTISESLRNINYILREQMLLFIHGCDLAFQLLPKSIDSSDEDESGVGSHSGGFVRDNALGGGFVHDASEHSASTGFVQDSGFVQDNIYHDSASVIKLLCFHYWIRSVLEFICADNTVDQRYLDQGEREDYNYVFDDVDGDGDF